jgi:peroxiredoxin
MRTTLGLCLLCLIATTATAGKFNKTLSVGDAAPSWTKLTGTDDKPHSLADLQAFDCVVVVFTCTSCPVAIDYEDRILSFAKKFTSGPNAKVALVAINVNTGDDDALPAMKKRAEKKKFPFTYLYDPTQAIAKQYGAIYTPEFFVLNPARKIAYLGALDDKNNAADAKTDYLDAAVSAVLAGKAPETTETLARGCKIRYNRDSR